MMSSHILLLATLLFSTVTANMFGSGMFLVRISSEERHSVQYCFTELPYSVRRSPDNRCLKSGELNVAKRTERVIDLRLMNSTSVYLTVEFKITARGQGPPNIVAERVVVDGALPAKRVAVSSGLVMEFVTICDRPWYGLMCSRYCIERSDANYVCDPRGEKVCLVGWTGKDCDIATKNAFPTVPDDTTEASPTFSAPTTIPSTGRLPSQSHGPRMVSTTAAAPVTSSPLHTTTTNIQVATVSTPKLRSTSIRGVHRTRIGLAATSRSTHRPPTSTISSQREIMIEVTQNTSPPSNQHSTYSYMQIALTVFLAVIAIVSLGYLLMVCARNSSVQNWVNTRKAKVFAHGSCPSFRHYEHDERIQKVFVIDKKNTDVKLDYESTEKLGPRYSSQPTAAAEQPLSANDESLVESNTYHEIDSFFVPSVVDLRIPSVVDLRIATLV